MAEAVRVMAEKNTQARGSTGKVLDTRHRQWPQFGGSQFEDWSFAFKRNLRAVDPMAFTLLTKVETMVEVEWDDLRREFGTVDLVRYSAEIFDVLCQAVSGEALQVIRTVDDMEGFEAWQKLVGKYSPKSMARAVRIVGMVTNPPKITDLTKAEAELDKWEEHVKVLKRDFKENFSDTVKVGIVTSMMPISVQEMIYQSIGKNVNYDEVVQKVRAVISNKVAIMGGTGPVPMEIGEVGDGMDDGEEIGAVSANTRCYGCGGWGHVSSNCPTVFQGGKGKGKAGKGGKGGKGAYDAGKGGGKGGKGSKSGFKGSCYNCGKAGHIAAHCRQANAVSEKSENEDELEALVGGVWMVGHVDATTAGCENGCACEGGWKSVRRASRRKCYDWESGAPFQIVSEANHNNHVEIKNGFDALREVEVSAVDWSKPLTRLGAIEFNVGDVRKPLASAAMMVKCGNVVVLDQDGSYIMNKATGECMEVKVKDETFVFEVQFENGEKGTITLDTGAGVHVWPKDMLVEVPIIEKKPGLRMCAANGSEFKNYGRKLIKFRGNYIERPSPVFMRPVPVPH